MHIYYFTNNPPHTHTHIYLPSASLSAAHLHIFCCFLSGRANQILSFKETELNHFCDCKITELQTCWIILISPRFLCANMHPHADTQELFIVIIKPCRWIIASAAVTSSDTRCFCLSAFWELATWEDSFEKKKGLDNDKNPGHT